MSSGDKKTRTKLLLYDSSCIFYASTSHPQKWVPFCSCQPLQLEVEQALFPSPSSVSLPHWLHCIKFRHLLPLAVFADLDANGWYTSPKSDSPFRIISHPVCSVFVASLFTIQQGSGRKFTFCGFLGLVSTSIQIWVSQWTNHFAQLTKIHQPENKSNIRRIYHWSILTNDNLPHSTCCFGHPVFSDQLEVIRNTRPFRPFSVLCFGTSQLFDLELS